MDKWGNYRNFFNKCFNFIHSLFFIRLIWNKIRYKKYFDNIENQPLTGLQRESIILNEKRNLVVAGAGTGKTSTIIGKIGYLIKSKKAKSDEILTLAYNRSAANELRERIKNRINLNVQAQTFHSLGNLIIKSSNDQQLKVSSFVDQELKLHKFLNKIIKESIKDPLVKSKMIQFFSELLFPYKDERSDFNSISEYASWIKSMDLITFAGEKVKSYGEFKIANFLFKNGIEYTYEKYYEPKRRLDDPVAYRPDFHINNTDIYIEYFGIDENGKTANYIDSNKYIEQIERKREIHKNGNTKLIQIYYHEFKKNKWKNILSRELKKDLKRNKIQIDPLSNEQILLKIQENELHIPFVKLIAQFLEHYKSNLHKRTLENIRSEIKYDERTNVFLDIFEEVFKNYQNYLKTNNEIDFNDMINLSSKIVEERRFISKWKYLLVDEYQDISWNRYNLIHSIVNQNKNSKLFCVGDDWQSIYRFAGSDISLMKNFRNYFGRSSVIKLDTTFRFDNQISKTSEKFILKNPNQIKKSLKTLSESHSPSVFLQWSNKLPSDATRDLIEKLSTNKEINEMSLQILARYNHNLPNNEEIKYVISKWKGKVLQPKSIHALKGLEADIIVVTDLISGKNLGFPSLREDDPILETVLSSKENFPYAEERRLLYVAITRAKKYCYLISDPNNPSEFSKELTEKKFVKIGKIIKLFNTNGEFVVSEHFSKNTINNIHNVSEIWINNFGQRKLTEIENIKIFKKETIIKISKNLISTKEVQKLINSSIEIEENKYPIEEINNQYDPKKRCLECNEGYVFLKKYENFKGDINDLYSCSNYPVCDYVGSRCKNCNCLIIKNETGYICETDSCKTKYDNCTKCNDGILIYWDGKNGEFIACNLFLKTGCKGKK